jgi:hypothetical protein
MDYVLRDLSLKLIEPPPHFDPNGMVLVFEDPKPDSIYYMGVDIGSGLGITNSVIHILRQGTLWEPDVQALEFAADFLDPHELAPIVNMLGWEYKSDVDNLPAMACIENNNKGESTQYDLMTYYQYPNIYIKMMTETIDQKYASRYGWETTPRTRPRLVTHGISQLKKGHWRIGSPWFVDELQDFRVGKLLTNEDMDMEREAAKARKESLVGRDDRVMAGLIAQYCCHEMRIYDEMDPAVQRARMEAERQQHREALRQGEEPHDFRNTDTTYEEMNKYHGP